jgi:hypothetical protein
VRRSPLQARLDLVALRWIGSIGGAANARELGRAEPRLGAVTANHVGERTDSAASLFMQLEEFVGRALDQLSRVQER